MSDKSPAEKIPFFSRFSYFLRALWIFSPSIIFLALGLFLFTSLSQGKDIIYQSTDGINSWKTGLYLVIAAIFWVFTSWYTSRLIAYNRNDLYEVAPRVLYHFPRLVAYLIFLVLWIAVFLINDIDGHLSAWAWAAAILDIGVYLLFHENLEKSLQGIIPNERRKRLVAVRWAVRGLIFLSCLFIILKWKDNHVQILLYILPVFQLGFLFLVIARRPLFVNDPRYVKNEHLVRATRPATWFGKYMRWTFKGISTKFDLSFEKPIFVFFHVFVAFAFICYIASINSLSFAREITSFPFVLLAFGILLGIINMIALVSYRQKINFNFLLIVLIIAAGFIFDTHRVRLMDAANSKDRVFANRMSFQNYIKSWISWHQDDLDKDTLPYPVFFVLADGGASRSGYWAASVLSALHERTRYNSGSADSYFMDHLLCLSGASGGSVGNTVFLSSYAIQQQEPQLKTDTLCREYLGNDFLVYPLARLLGPEIIQPVFGWIPSWKDRAYALERGMDYPATTNGSVQKIIKGSFSRLLPNPQNRFPILSINTTRVNDGSPGIVSTIHIDSSGGIFGKRIDVLDSIPQGKDIRVSTAMVLGARFPYMSPGGRIGKSYYVDGGYFDNSGAGVVHEMLLELNRMALDSLNPLSKYAKRLHFYVIHLSNTPYSSPTANKSIHPMLNDLATPLLTLAGSYQSQTSVNDARLINYLKEVNKTRNSYIIFNLYRQDTVESIPMNWVISNKVRYVMDTRVHQKPGIDSLVNRIRERRLDSLFHGLGINN
jgi:hypothetical protein